MGDIFHKFASIASHIVGSAWTFTLALTVVFIWAISGPYFGFSNTWQLFINTGTTIVTFLMVFLIQNTQNRDSKAMHIKLDELIVALKGASDGMVGLEDIPDEELEKYHEHFKKMHEHYSRELERRNSRKKHPQKKEA